MSAEVSYWGIRLWVCERCQGHGHIVLEGGPGWIPDGRPEDTPVFSKHQALEAIFYLRDQGLISGDVAEECGGQILKSPLPEEIPSDIRDFMEAYSESELRLERCLQGKSDLEEVEIEPSDLSSRIHGYLMATRRPKRVRLQ